MANNLMINEVRQQQEDLRRSRIFMRKGEQKLFLDSSRVRCEEEKHRDPRAWREERAEGQERKMPEDGENRRENDSRGNYLW